MSSRVTPKISPNLLSSAPVFADKSLKPLKRRPLACLLAVLCTLPAVAAAQTAAAPVEISIAAQPVASALNQLAQQVGMQLLVAPELVAGKTAPAVQGTLPYDVALKQLLAGSGLEASRQGNVLVVRRVPAAAAPGKEAVLPEVAVVASSTAMPEPGTRRAESFSTETTRLGVLGERPLLDTPFSVNVVTSELMENMGVTDLKTLARVDPALSPSFSGIGYYDAVSIRGLQLNNWTNYYKNGLLFPNQAKTTFENIDRIEVQRGLTGFLQGFAAPGGSVNYVTERPTSTWQRRVELNVDEFGTIIAGVDLGGPVTEDGRLGIRVNAAGGQEKYFVREVETDRGFGSIALDWKPTDTVSVRFDAQTERREGTTQPNLLLDVNGAIPQGVDPRRYLGQPWQTYDTRTREFGLAADWKFARNWTASFMVNDSYLYRDDFTSNIDNIQPNGDFDVIDYNSPDETRDARNAEIALRGDLALAGMRHEVAFGVATRKLTARFGDGVFETVGTSNLYQPVPIADPNSVAPPSYTAFINKDRGVFVSDFITFNEQWQALVGVRHAKVDFFSVFDTQKYENTVTTPNAALIYKPQPNISLYASYAEGLEQGGTAPTRALNSNEQLRPVTAKQREIGIKGDLMGGRIAASAALFETKLPLAYLDTDSNVFGYFGTRRHRGLELTATGGLWEGARIHTGAVILDAKALNIGNPANNGCTPSGVAEKQATVWLDQALPVAGLSAQVGARYSSRRAVNNDDSLFVPSWTVFDAGLRYQTNLYGKKVHLGLNVFNLTDKT